MADKRPIVVSGMRPTGRLHLGHLHGALSNWVKLQAENDCFYFSADWHALTTSYDRTEVIQQAEREMFVDFIAAGIDPERATLFVQSQVKQHVERFQSIFGRDSFLLPLRRPCRMACPARAP